MRSLVMGRTNKLQNNNRWQEAGDPTREKRVLQQVAEPAYSTAALLHRMGRSNLLCLSVPSSSILENK
ncbi:hypothetical protein VULLAG_LOCUS6954 [Vulpes lagopus]